MSYPLRTNIPLTSSAIRFLAHAALALLLLGAASAEAGGFGPKQPIAADASFLSFAPETSVARSTLHRLPPSHGIGGPDAPPVIPASATGAAYRDQVQEVYIAYYQRPADPGGLVWWSGQLATSGGSLNAIIDSFANSREASDLYGPIDSGTIAGVIGSMYQALFNRAPDAAGLQFYVDGFNAGTFTPGTIALNILDGAINDDAYAIDNKLRAANLFTRALDPSLTGDPRDLRATNYAALTAEVRGRDLLADVTFDPASFPTPDEINQYIRDWFTNPGDPILTDDSVPSVVDEADSESGGSIATTDGAEVELPPGAISTLDDGSAGQTSLSIEPNVPQEEWPAPLPDGYEPVSGVYLVGPTGFVFTQPVPLYLPAYEAASPDDLTVLHYDEGTSQWVPLITAEVDPVQRRLGVNVFELGYFVVAHSPLLQEGAIAPASPNERRVGGIRLIHDSYSHPVVPKGYYYYLTVAAVQYLYPEVGWPNLVGYSVSTGDEVTSGPRGQTWMMNVPQGTYTISVSRRRAGTLSEPPGEMETWSRPVTVDVGPYTRVFGGWGYAWEMFSGWTDLLIVQQAGDEWRTGSAEDWPTPTVPYGTGEVNITLEWTNTNDSSADLDLHLYGPDGMHVYYGATSSPDGSLHLDRDWRSANGNASENIYSTSGLPAGEYQVAVDHWGGDVPKSFSVRVKLGTSVRTYRHTVDVYGETIDIETFSVD